MDDGALLRESLSVDGDADEAVLEITGNGLADVSLAEAESLFGLDFVKVLVRAIPKDIAVSSTFGTDLPLVMTDDIADGGGHVTRMLARTFDHPER